MIDRIRSAGVALLNALDSMFRDLWRVIASWPDKITGWWRNLFVRERARRAGRVHMLAVWVQEDDENIHEWISHYLGPEDLSYSMLTKAEADELAEWVTDDAHALGLRIVTKVEVNRAFI